MTLCLPWDQEEVVWRGGGGGTALSAPTNNGVPLLAVDRGLPEA